MPQPTLVLPCHRFLPLAVSSCRARGELVARSPEEIEIHIFLFLFLLLLFGCFAAAGLRGRRSGATTAAAASAAAACRELAEARADQLVSLLTIHALNQLVQHILTHVDATRASAAA